MRPRIGILGDRREASYGSWRGIDLCFVWQHYVDAVSAAGGAAAVFPPEAWLESDPALMLDAVDGLLLSGGRDIVASVYGSDPHPSNEPGDANRDRVELALTRVALERRMPILGVCRGMQLLNIALGGGIEQHLADTEASHRPATPGSFVTHEVSADEGSRLSSILGPGPFPVRSHHHQGVAELGRGLFVSGRSPDGVVEAIEASDSDVFCLAVLWHPEEDLEEGGLALYAGLVGAARSTAASIRDRSPIGSRS